MSQALRRALGQYATGVTVITTLGSDGRPVGMTANSFSSLSMDPPLVLWSIGRKSSNFVHFEEAPCFAVHVLHAGQAGLAARFATRDVDRFEGVAAGAGASGAPQLDDFLAHFDCSTEARLPGGDHLILVGRVLAFDEREGLAPLVFHGGRYAELNNERGSAP